MSLELKCKHSIACGTAMKVEERDYYLWFDITNIIGYTTTIALDRTDALALIEELQKFIKEK